MPRYVIERDISGVGEMGPEDLKSISQILSSVTNKLGNETRWIHSYVTGSKLYCIFNAQDEETLVEHAKLSGMPITSIHKVVSIMDPSTVV